MMSLTRAVLSVCICVVLPVAAQSRPPEITLAVNTGAGQDAFAGWPVLVHATFAVADDDSTWVLEPETVSIAIQDGSGATVDAVPVSHGAPAGPVTLNSDHDVLTLRWTLSPEQTARLSGTYAVQLTVGDRQVRTSLAVKTEPSPLPLELASARRLLLADYNLTIGNNGAALDAAKEELRTDSTSLAAMSRAASALERMGQNDDALAMLNQAIEEFGKQFPTATHPPLELMRRQRNLTLAAAGVAIR